MNNINNTGENTWWYIASHVVFCWVYKIITSAALRSYSRGRIIISNVAFQNCRYDIGTHTCSPLFLFFWNHLQIRRNRRSGKCAAEGMSATCSKINRPVRIETSTRKVNQTKSLHGFSALVRHHFPSHCMIQDVSVGNSNPGVTRPCHAKLAADRRRTEREAAFLTFA